MELLLKHKIQHKLLASGDKNAYSRCRKSYRYKKHIKVSVFYNNMRHSIIHSSALIAVLMITFTSILSFYEYKPNKLQYP